MLIWIYFVCVRYEFQRVFMLVVCWSIYNFINGSKKYLNFVCWNVELVDILFGFDILVLFFGLIL